MLLKPSPFSEYTPPPPPPPFPATNFRTFSTRDAGADVLVTTDTFGPNSTGIGDDNPPTNFATKATLASSASIDERRDPSPSLFNDDRLGNSHSISGNVALLGLDNAFRTDDMAEASRSAGEEGILAEADDDLATAPRRRRAGEEEGFFCG
jgi:hypothetical protein